jgi:hypothetical protein
VNWSRPGVFARDRLLLESLDALSVNYIHAKVEAFGQTPAQVVGALVPLVREIDIAKSYIAIQTLWHETAIETIWDYGGLDIALPFHQITASASA